MWPLVVVVPAESVAKGLQFVDRGRGPVVGVEVLEGAVVALQLATRLWVRRSGAELADAHGGQALLEVHWFVTVAGDELRPVVADELPWGAMLGDGGFHGPPRGGGGEPPAGGGANSEAGMVVEDVDHPGNRSVGQCDLGAVDLPQVVGCIAFEAPPGWHCATLRSWRDQ